MNDFTVLPVIQARVGSTRLPGKALVEIAGRPLTEHVVRRVNRALSKPVLALPDTADNDRLAEQAEGWPCHVIRGPEEDVLRRFIKATDNFQEADFIARITGDNPLLSMQLLELTAREALRTGAALTSPALTPLGVSTGIVKIDALREADQNADEKADREHVTTWVKRKKKQAQHRFLPPSIYRAPAYRLTVDRQPDLDLIRELYDRSNTDQLLPTARAIELLDTNPELLNINCSVRQKYYGGPPTSLHYFFNCGGEWGHGHRSRFHLLSNEILANSAFKRSFYSTGGPNPSTPSDELSIYIPQTALPITETRPELNELTIAKDTRRSGADAVVLDVKQSSRDLVEELQKNTNVVIGIEDRGDGRDIMDAVFDPNLYPGVLKNDSLAEEKQFYGPDYALIDPQFSKIDPAPVSSQFKRVGLCFGGTDPAGIAQKFIGEIVEAFPHLDFFHYGPDPGVKVENLHCQGIISNPAEEFAGHDFLFISGGVIKFELAALKRPTAVITQNREQTLNTKRFLKYNQISWPCFDKNSSPQGWHSLLEKAHCQNYRQSMVDSLEGVVDGRGLQRLLDFLENKVE